MGRSYPGQRITLPDTVGRPPRDARLSGREAWKAAALPTERRVSPDLGRITIILANPSKPERPTAGTTIQEQTRQCLANIAAILKAASSSMEQVVSATFILRRPEELAGMNEELARWFPVDPPARQGAKDPLEVGDALISIAAIAVT